MFYLLIRQRLESVKLGVTSREKHTTEQIANRFPKSGCTNHGFALFDRGGEPPVHSWDYVSQQLAASGVGGWCNGIIHINLLSKVSSATQDRLSVVPESGHVTTMNASAPLLDGISHKRRIHSIVGVPGRLILAISGTRPRSTHRGSYQGSEYRNYLTPENLVLSVSSEGRHKLNMRAER